MVASPRPAEPPLIVTFYSYAGGVGRTGTLANVALILASAGNSVLVIDADLASPTLHRYLAAFLPPGSSTAPMSSQPIRLSCEFVGGPDTSAGSIDFLGPLSDRADSAPGPAAGGADARWRVDRKNLLGLSHDFVLIDSPAGVSDEVTEWTVATPDVLVVGFGLSRQAIDGGAGQVRAVRAQDPRRVRVLPVPMHVDTNAHGIVERMRAVARSQFDSLLHNLTDEERRRYWDEVEIPYQPDYSSEERLAALDDPGEQRDALVRAYRRLATDIAVAAGGVLAANPIPAPTRDRYRAARGPSTHAQTVTQVVHAARDRVWAEWIIAELNSSGLRGERLRADSADAAAAIATASSVLLVLSSDLTETLETPRSAALADMIARRSGSGNLVAFGAQIDDTPPPSALSAINHVPLAAMSAVDTARKALRFLYFGTTAARFRERARPGAAPRFPGAGGGQPGRVSGVPPRDPAFVGREDVLDKVRDHHTSAGSRQPFVLAGPPGVGKTLAAIEYAHRFASEYDLVRLIPADSRQSVQEHLAGIGAELQVPKQGDAPTASLDRLQSADYDMRWLLIYDGADDPGVLAGLVPAKERGGHVIVTSRQPGGEQAQTAALAPFRPTETRRLLAKLVAGITDSDIQRTAALVGNVPLAVRLAAAWMSEVASRLRDVAVAPADVVGEAVAEFVEQLERRLSSPPGEAGPPAGSDPLAATITLLLELLERHPQGAAGVRLLELCACLSPLGVSWQLLNSAALLAQLRAVDDALSDPVTLHNVVRSVARHGFLVPGQEPRVVVRLHRLIVESLRDRMPADRLRDRQTEAVHVLAAYAPTLFDPDDTTRNESTFAELQRHLEPSAAIDCVDEPVRCWLVDQIRYLWQTNEASTWAVAADLGQRLVRAWEAAVPSPSTDPLLLRLKVQLANVRRSRSEFTEAFQLDSHVLATQRAVLGLRHPRTLMTARGYAADLRMRGDFEDALLEDQSTWQAFRESLGDDHELTLAAASNLSYSLYLAGDPRQALSQAEANYRRWTQLPWSRPEEEAWARYDIGTFLRELGDLDRSHRELLDARAEFDALVGREKIRASHYLVLQARLGLAMTKRQRGEPTRPLTEQTLAAYRAAYGERYLGTLSCALALAADLHADGMHEAAARDATAAIVGLDRLFGADHPFTHICQVNIGSYARAAGDRKRAEEMSDAGWGGLARRLGSAHPWTLAAAVARANALVAADRLDEALAIEEATRRSYQGWLGADHLFTRSVESNASDTRLRLVAGPNVGTLRRTGGRARYEPGLDVPPGV
jgi:cellulose biosynthesis protein BcsQ